MSSCIWSAILERFGVESIRQSISRRNRDNDDDGLCRVSIWERADVQFKTSMLYKWARAFNSARFALEYSGVPEK